MPKQFSQALVIALLAAAVVVYLRLHASNPPPLAPASPTAPAPPASGNGSIPEPTAHATRFGSNVGFHSRDRLEEHYRKHGREFGDITLDEYLRRAQTLRDAPAGGKILETIRGDGVVTRFDRESGAFLAFNPDGTIRTFFRPNDGEAYFRRQAQREEHDG